MKSKTKYFILAVLFGIMALTVAGYASWNIHLQTDIVLNILPTEGSSSEGSSYADQRLDLFEKYIKWCEASLPSDYTSDTVLEASSGQDYSIEVDTGITPTGASTTFAELKIGFNYEYYVKATGEKLTEKPTAAGEYYCKIIAKSTDASADNQTAIENLNKQNSGCAAIVNYKINSLTLIPLPTVNTAFTFDATSGTYHTVYDGTPKTFFTNAADFSAHVTGLTSTSATEIGSYTITLTPIEDCVWADSSTGARKYTFRIEKPVCYNLTKNIYYATVEEALAAAVSGDILYLIPGENANYHPTNNKVVPDRVEYTIKSNCEIKSGVTLILPTDNQTLSSVTNASSLNTYITEMYTADTSETSTSYASETNYLRCTLNIAEGVTLTNNGQLVVSGYLSAGNSGACRLGHTAYSYAQIKMGKNASIVQNSSATTYLFGYILEQTDNNGSTVDINSGTLYVPFIINDYRGFSFSWAMTDGAIDNNRCSAFNQFELRNVHALTTIKYGAIVSSYVNVLVKYDATPKVNKAFSKEIKLIGTTTDYFLQLTNSDYSYVKYKYSNKNAPAQLDIYGGATLNYINLQLKESILSVDLSTKNAYFPLSYRMSVSLNKNENQTANAVYDLTKQRIKLLPGSQLTINGGCDVDAEEIIVYSAFYDGEKGNGKNSANAYSGVAYPLKEGAKLIVNDYANLTSNKLAGTVYKSDQAQINYTTNTITAKEAWKYGSSGNVSPVWTINEYLEIRERLNLVSLDYLDTKIKIYVGLNTFTNYNIYLPTVNVITDNVNSFTVSEYQNVLFFDSISEYRLEFISNVYLARYNASTYSKGQTVSYSASNSIIGVINSTLSISNNNNGVNEFNVQEVNVSCTTPTVDGKIPLFVDSTIQLAAEVIDIEKAYNKTITWKSLDTSIATVDSDGAVTGVALGKVTIQAVCDGVIGTIELEVIEQIVTSDVESVYITDNNGNTSEKTIGKSTFGGSTEVAYHGKYGNNKNIVLKININPANAPYTSIHWSFTGTGPERNYMNDIKQTTSEADGVTEVTVHTLSGTNTSDDKITVVCEVTDLKGTKHKATFILNHQADISCLVEGTLITLADGTKKKVEDLTVNDKFLVFNHEAGKWDAAPFMLMVHAKTPANYHRVVELMFSNNSVLRITYEHGLFDKDLNKYVLISEDNAQDFIGHSFVTSEYRNGEFITSSTKLVDVTVRREYVRIFNPVSTWHVNVVANDFLTTSPYMANFFEYDETLKYDEKLMQEDIDKYGLYTYEDFKDYIPETSFAVFPYSYFKVAVGKGISTFDNILCLLSHALDPDTLLAPSDGITQYTISLDASGGKCSTNIINVTMGDTYSTSRNNEGNVVGLPQPTREGYIFAGWYIKDTDILITDDTKVGNLTLYGDTITFVAKWSISTDTPQNSTEPNPLSDVMIPPSTSDSTQNSSDEDSSDDKSGTGNTK